jgi:hypothetical protein
MTAKKTIFVVVKEKSSNYTKKQGYQGAGVERKS